MCFTGSVCLRYPSNNYLASGSSVQISSYDGSPEIWDWTPPNADEHTWYAYKYIPITAELYLNLTTIPNEQMVTDSFKNPKCRRSQVDMYVASNAHFTIQRFHFMSEAEQSNLAALLLDQYLDHTKDEFNQNRATHPCNPWRLTNINLPKCWAVPLITSQTFLKHQF